MSFDGYSPVKQMRPSVRPINQWRQGRSVHLAECPSAKSKAIYVETDDEQRSVKMRIHARLRRILRWLTPVVVTTMALSSGPSWAQPNDATRILKTMSDFVAKQQNVSITFDADIEVITPDVQKIQFTNSG